MQSKSKMFFEFSYPCSTIDTCQPIKINLVPGFYYFEAWGAKGGDTTYFYCPNGFAAGPRGGYTAGKIKITQSTQIFVYIGSRGSSYPNTDFAAYNGGGKPIDSGGGGGATDFRLIGGNADSPDSYLTRILVAGGGGGSDCRGIGGVGGGIYGGNATGGGFGGTQSAGGYGENGNGDIWKGASVTSDNTAGGGGYFGGGSGSSIPGNGQTGGGGGSSYISGHPQCSKYPGYVFTDYIVLSGADEIPSPTGYEYNA